MSYSSQGAPSPFPVDVPQAACDGVTDATSAIKKAIVEAQSGGNGGTVRLPAGICHISGTSTIDLNEIALIGSEVPHYSDGSAGAGIFKAGTVLSVGKLNVSPGMAIPFRFGHSVTLRGINFIYPYQIAKGIVNGAPISAPPLFSDTKAYGGIGNILLDNVHVVGAYDFWVQDRAGFAATYGNIRFDNTDVYAINTVFTLSNVQESMTFSNFLSNPSLCNGGSGGCSDATKNWTSDNGTWMRIVGAIGSTGYKSAVAGIQASNLTVASYKSGIVIEDNGHLDETLFGPTSVFDGVPRVLFVGANGSITHTSFSSKVQFGGRSRSGKPYNDAAFTLSNPQAPQAGSRIIDYNSLSLNGLTADGLGGALLEAFVTDGNIGSITMTGVVVRHYCDALNLPQTSAVRISTPHNAKQSTAVIIVGSQITTDRVGCGGLDVNTNGAPLLNMGNLIGYYPLN